jgi:large subunit ribosomal protein L11
MKKVIANLKLQIPATKATPAPPVGPALAQYGINISDFCQKFNDTTKGQEGYTIPVEVTVYEDRSYTFVTKQPLTSELLKKAAGIEKGSGFQKTTKAGKINKAQIREIAQKKMADFNTEDIEKAMKIVKGSARAMGLEVVD